MDIIRFGLLILYVLIAAHFYEKFIYPYNKKYVKYKFLHKIAVEDMKKEKAKQLLKKAVYNCTIFVFGHIAMIFITIIIAQIII